MKIRLALGVWLTLAALLCAFSPAVRLRARPAASNPAFTPDKGKFRILQQGAEAGTETFELSPSGANWIMRGETIIRAGKSESRSTGQLRLNAEGNPVHYEWTSQAPKKASGSVDFMGPLAKTSITIESKAPYHQDFTFTSPRVAILDNNLYDQYAILAALYDWNARGKQTFPVLIPQDLTPGTINVEAVGQSEGREELRASTPDLEIELFLDSKHHLVRMEVPAANVVIERQ